MAKKLTFTAYTDLALARLYEAEGRDGSSRVIDLYNLMADITDQGIDREWAYQAAQWIVDHGYGHDFLTMGSATTQLTGDGRMYVEAGTGIISDYQQSPQIVVVSGDGNQVAVGHGQTVTQSGSFEKEEISELLDRAEAALAADETLTESEREDAFTDVKAMRAQIAKATPNRQVLTALATGLGSVASLVDIADKLHHALG
jgi:hypothetical protein